AHNFPVEAEGYAGNIVQWTTLTQRVQKLRKRLFCLAAHHQINRRICLQSSDIHRRSLRSAESNNRCRLLPLYFTGNAQRDWIAAANAAEAKKIKLAFAKIRRGKAAEVAFVAFIFAPEVVIQ